MINLTLNGINPISNNPTSTTLLVEEIEFDLNDIIYNKILKGNGRDWKRYHLLEDAKGFARFHDELNKPNGQWLTLLWSITSIEAKTTLELPIQNSAENKSLCHVDKVAIFWVAKHTANDNEQVYVEEIKNIHFIVSQKT